MLFYQIGELFQSVAVGKSRKNITSLMDIRPDYANIELNGKLEKIDPDDVEIGTEIVVNPGEKVPIDGVIISGDSTLNTSALTGESVPRSAKVGDEIISGCSIACNSKLIRECCCCIVKCKFVAVNSKFRFKCITILCCYID